jgi:hypothetical protein
MAEHASDAPLQNRPETTRRARRASSASVTAPLRSASAARPGVSTRWEDAPSETAADRYAFYFFMGTVTIGILAMIVMAFSI